MNEIVSWKTWKGWKGFLQINSKKIFCFIKFKFQNELFSVKTLPFKSNPSANTLKHIHVIIHLMLCILLFIYSNFQPNPYTWS